MNFATQNMENLLRRIRDEEPNAWFPRVYAEEKKVPLEAINYFLEELHLDGLLERGGTSSESTGPGVVLTQKGWQLLSDEAALGRLRAGLPIDPRDRGGQVRQFLRVQSKPWITRLLLLLNFAVFGYEIYLANPRGRIHDLLGFSLQGGNQLTPLLMASGAIRGDRILEGEWWRLLSCSFVHIGLLHLFSNMYVLWREGLYFEGMWGWWRYLIIYLGSGLGGALLAVSYQPLIAMAGASGALCGLLSSAGVWMFLNRRYLPKPVFNRWIGAFIISVLLITFLSLFPGVSGLAHGGGALLGVVLALLLNWQRFGSGLARWLGLALILPLGFLGYLLHEHQRLHNDDWKRLEQRHFEQGTREEPTDGPGYLLLKKIDQLRKMCEVRSGQISGIWRRDQANWKERDPQEVKILLEELDQLDDRFHRLQNDLMQARQRYRQPANITFIDRSQTLMQSLEEVFQFFRGLLRQDELSNDDRERVKEQAKRGDAALEELRRLERNRLEQLKGSVP